MEKVSDTMAVIHGYGLLNSFSSRLASFILQETMDIMELISVCCLLAMQLPSVASYKNTDTLWPRTKAYKDG